jgi:hypothetical protein
MSQKGLVQTCIKNRDNKIPKREAKSVESASKEVTRDDAKLPLWKKGIRTTTHTHMTEREKNAFRFASRCAAIVMGRTNLATAF